MLLSIIACGYFLSLRAADSQQKINNKESGVNLLEKICTKESADLESVVKPVDSLLKKDFSKSLTLSRPTLKHPKIPKTSQLSRFLDNNEFSKDSLVDFTIKKDEQNTYSTDESKKSLQEKFPNVVFREKKVQRRTNDSSNAPSQGNEFLKNIRYSLNKVSTINNQPPKRNLPQSTVFNSEYLQAIKNQREIGFNPEKKRPFSFTIFGSSSNNLVSEKIRMKDDSKFFNFKSAFSKIINKKDSLFETPEKVQPQAAKITEYSAANTDETKDIEPENPQNSEINDANKKLSKNLPFELELKDAVKIRRSKIILQTSSDDKPVEEEIKVVVKREKPPVAPKPSFRKPLVRQCAIQPEQDIPDIFFDLAEPTKEIEPLKSNSPTENEQKMSDNLFDLAEPTKQTKPLKSILKKPLKSNSPTENEQKISDELLDLAEPTKQIESRKSNLPTENEQKMSDELLDLAVPTKQTKPLKSILKKPLKSNLPTENEQKFSDKLLDLAEPTKQIKPFKSILKKPLKSNLPTENEQKFSDKLLNLVEPIKQIKPLKSILKNPLKSKSLTENEQKMSVDSFGKVGFQQLPNSIIQTVVQPAVSNNQETDYIMKITNTTENTPKKNQSVNLSSFAKDPENQGVVQTINLLNPDIDRCKKEDKIESCIFETMQPPIKPKRLHLYNVGSLDNRKRITLQADERASDRRDALVLSGCEFDIDVLLYLSDSEFESTNL